MGAVNRFFSVVNATAAAAAGFLLLVNAATAQALPVVVPSQAPHPPATVLRPAHSSSAALNWAGYVAREGTYTLVSGTWTVPQVAADESEADATWVGIGGAGTSDLIQAGTEAIAVRGGVVYQAWYELLPDASRPIPVPIRSGDSVTVSISETAPGQWRIYFSNNTAGQVWSSMHEYASSRASAEWIVEVPAAIGERLWLSDFGSVTFSRGHAVKNGRAVSIEDADARAVTLVNAAGSVAAQPSVLTRDGAGFAVVRHARVDASASVLSADLAYPGVPSFLEPLARSATAADR